MYIAFIFHAAFYSNFEIKISINFRIQEVLIITTIQTCGQIRVYSDGFLQVEEEL